MLRDYQVRVIADVRAAFGTGARSVVAVAPCGAGKTVIFSAIAKLAAERNTKTAILVHRDSLLTQASAKLREAGVTHGIIAPGHGYYSTDIHVASVQTLVRRLPRHAFDLLVVDECHHATSGSYSKIFAHYPKAKILGVTATPERTDGKGLDAVFQRLVLGPSIADLIADGYLVEPITYGPTHKLDLSGISTKMGDYDTAELASHMDTPRITGDAISSYSQICPGVPAVVFAVNIKHAEDVAAAFAAKGYRSATVNGKMDIATIRARIAGLSDGSVQVLTACDLISEGTDIPAVVCAINLRATKSKGLHIQQGGRALRPIYAPGHDLATRSGRLAAIAWSSKPKAIILDHAANYARHMPIDEPHEWTLAGRKRKSGNSEPPIPVRQCPKCFAAHRPAPRCPMCNHLYEVKTTAPEVTEGTLSPIDKIALRRSRWREERDCKTLGELQELGKRRGFRPGWAWHRWTARNQPTENFFA